MRAFFRRFNSHAIAHFGLTLVAIAGVPELPQVKPIVTALPAHTQSTVGIVQAALIALGSALAYLGAPIGTTPAPPPSTGG